MYAFSHTRIAALSGEKVKLSKGMSRFIPVRENFTALDSDAILSGTPKDGIDLDPYRLFLSILYSFIS